MDRLFVTVSHLNACCVNKHSSLLIRSLIALPILLLLLTATTRPVPHPRMILQPIAFDQGSPDAVIAEPKHFAVHGVPEAGSMAGSSSADIRLNDSLRVIPHL
jgi:hypothetical protein